SRSKTYPSTILFKLHAARLRLRAIMPRHQRAAGGTMDTRQFFLEQYDTVCFIVNELFLKGITDDQMRRQPDEGLNSMAWYLWHTSRWQDYANTLIDPNS